MPSRKGKNLRSGDLAEQLGIYLLQSVALIAPVPRTEDVGIDVVATLIRNFDQYSYLAEDSFYVQIKSDSVKEIVYENEEVQWISQLKLPFFIMLVDKRNLTMKLYTCKRLYDALAINKDRKVIRLLFDKEETFKIYDFVDKDENDIYIGPEIIRMSINDLMEDENRIKELFYKILKEHIRIIHETFETWVLGYGTTYLWEANALPEKVGNKACTGLNISEDELFGKMMAYLIKALEVSLKKVDFGMIDEAESVIAEHRLIFNEMKAMKDKVSTFLENRNLSTNEKRDED